MSDMRGVLVMRILYYFLFFLVSLQCTRSQSVINATQEAISTLLLGPRADFSVQNVGVLFLNLGGPDNLEVVMVLRYSY